MNGIYNHWGDNIKKLKPSWYKPRIIDEWQEVPTLWDGVRAEVDKRGLKEQFILTESSVPNKKGVLHSGVGRIHTVKMRPMSLYESNQHTIGKKCHNCLYYSKTFESIMSNWPGKKVFFINCIDVRISVC